MNDFQAWEVEIESYEKESGEEFGDAMKRAVLLDALPMTLRTHLISAGRCDNYKDLRARVREVVQGRR
eukprot:216492-Alexandrium_andersonii.AAC.1